MSNGEANLNPYAPPTEENRETSYTAPQSPADIDGGITFRIGLTRSTARRIWANKNPLLIIMMSVMSVIIVGYLLLRTQMTVGIPQNIAPVFAILTFVNIVGWLFGVFRWLGSEGTSIYDLNPLLQSPYQGQWNGQHCDVTFKDVQICFGTRQRERQRRPEGLRYQVALQSYSPARESIILPRENFTAEEWSRMKDDEVDETTEAELPPPSLPPDCVAFREPSRFQNRVFSMAEVFARRWILHLSAITTTLALFGFGSVHLQYRLILRNIPQWNNTEAFGWFVRTHGHTLMYYASLIVLFASVAALLISGILLYASRRKARPWDDTNRTKVWISDECVILNGPNAWAEVQWNDDVTVARIPNGYLLNTKVGPVTLLRQLTTANEWDRAESWINDRLAR